MLHMFVTPPAQNNMAAMIGDWGTDDWNPNDTSLAEMNNRHLGMWIKNNIVNEPFTFTAMVKASSGAHYQVNFVTTSGSDWFDGTWMMEFYLNTNLFNNGAWNYLEVDIRNKFKTMLPYDDIAEVEALCFWANDIQVDDIVLSGHSLTRSYQVVPGQSLGGVLGSYSINSNGGVEDKSFYYYNELGSVVMTTNASNALRSINEPDYFGNYQSGTGRSWGTRPDTLGLNGKFLDADSGLYNFGARWYDPERGRWMSLEPQGQDGLNLYRFQYNSPANGFGPNGYSTPYGIYVPAAEGYGANVRDYYAGILANPCSANMPRADAWGGGLFAALWTPKASEALFDGLSTGWSAGDLAASLAGRVTPKSISPLFVPGTVAMGGTGPLAVLSNGCREYSCFASLTGGGAPNGQVYNSYGERLSMRRGR